MTITAIGFELVSYQAIPMLPGHTFVISVKQKDGKTLLSTGKDVYHSNGLVLSNKRITATGRLHHLPERNSLFNGSLETIACIPMEILLENPLDIWIDLRTPNEKITSQLKQTAYIYFIKQVDQNFNQVPLYFEPTSVHSLSPTEIRFEVTLP
ncbi:hypothetical protein [Niallia sp. Krafla_26]|uniref:hypothetical protein n=1 Tax=Niallia sp. Krafla_26 TaxID=3064703 RepID=UPI003D181814